LFINAVIALDGSFVVADVPDGASLSVLRTAPGAYVVTIAGLGTGCPLPVANAFAPTFMYLNGGACGGGTLTTTVQTGDGVDHPFGLVAVGRGAEAAAARSAAPTVALPESDY
jgi:hypothetical protein